MTESVSLEQLTEMVADLAEEVAYGLAGHIRPPSQNKSLAVLTALRPSHAVDTTVAPGDICGKPRKKDDEDTDVCLRARGHEGGHTFGKRPV